MAQRMSPTEFQIEQSVELDHLDKALLKFRFGYVTGKVESLAEAARLFETDRFSVRQRESKAMAMLRREYGQEA